MNKEEEDLIQLFKNLSTKMTEPVAATAGAAANAGVSRLTLNLDPIKYLNSLPTYNGNFDNLNNFIELLDRVQPSLNKFENNSQLIFLDIIKSKLIGKAREAIEINNSTNSWEEIKKVLFQYFGDRKSVEELYDNLRGLQFYDNCQNFYDRIKTALRRLNNKTNLDKSIISSIETKKNCDMALRLFISKIPEPMKGILVCRQPKSLEEAMDILHESGYAYTRVNNNSNNIYNSNTNNNNSTQYRDSSRQYRNSRQTQDSSNNNNNNNHNSGQWRNSGQTRNYSNNYNSNSGQYKTNQNNNYNSGQYRPNQNNNYRSGQYRTNQNNNTNSNIYRNNNTNMSNNSNNNNTNNVEPMDTLSASYQRQVNLQGSDFQENSLQADYPI